MQNNYIRFIQHEELPIFTVIEFKSLSQIRIIFFTGFKHLILKVKLKWKWVCDVTGC